MNKTAQPPAVSIETLAELSDGLGDAATAVVSWEMGSFVLSGEPDVWVLVGELSVGLPVTCLEGLLKMSRMHFCISLLSV